jgi:hypothetical protein
LKPLKPSKPFEMKPLSGSHVVREPEQKALVPVARRGKTAFTLLGVLGVAGIAGLAAAGLLLRGQAASGQATASAVVAKPPATVNATVKEVGRTAASGARPVGSDPVAPALAAYRAGDYRAAEAAAQRFIEGMTASAPSPSNDAPVQVASLKAVATVPATRSTGSARPARISRSVRAREVTRRRDVLRARQVMAFAAARRKDLTLARARFAQVRTEAVNAAQALPEVADRPAPVDGSPAATLEENAAFQHAVCTAALGDKAAAEKEYIAFMRTYPESPLVHAAVKRIARFHGGDIPAEADAAWKQAMAAARAKEQERQRQASLCGPECLAELLKRQGRAGDTAETAALIEKLAREMKTGADGTTLVALTETARRHGFPNANGYDLSAKGLAAQRLPVITLIAPGHYVLVEKVGADGSVTYWDPNGGSTLPKGLPSIAMAGQSGATTPPAVGTAPAKEWKSLWKGITLVLHDAESVRKPAKAARAARTVN